MNDSLAHRTIKNALYGFVSYIWPIAFTLVVTPIIVHRLGIEQYGLYVLTLIVTGFFSLLNFGLVYAFVRELAKVRAGVPAAEKESLEKLYGATVVVFLLIGAVALITSLAIAYFGQALLNIPSEAARVGQIIFTLTGVTAIFNSLATVYGQIPYALQRQDIGTNIYITNITLLNILIIIALLLGQGLITLVALQTFSAFFILAAAYWYSQKLLPDLKPRLNLEKVILKPMFQFGGYIYLHNVSASFLSQIDRLIISGLLGPAAVTLYSLPNSVAEKTQGVIVSLSGILFPVTAELVKAGDQERLRRVYHRAMRMIALLAAALTGTILLLADKTLLFWVGEEIAASSTHLLYWLAPTYFLLALFLPTTHFLTGIGRAKFLGISSLSMAVLNIGLLVALLPNYGITGAAMAYLFSLAPLIYIFYHIEKKFLGVERVAVFYGTLLTKLAATGVIFAGFGWLVLRPLATNLTMLLVSGTLAVISYIGLYRLLGFFEQEEWQLFKDFLRSLFMKLKVLRA